MSFNIHVITAGGSVYEAYLKIDSHYPVSKIIIIKEKETPEKIEGEIIKVHTDCALRKKPCDTIEFKENQFEELMEQLIALRRSHPDDSFFFNITPGRKDVAIMTFIASLWIDGTGYYWPEEMERPFEFPIPKVALNELGRNKLHVAILQELHAGETENQTRIRNRINKNPNTQKELSPQTFSASVTDMEAYGLVTRTRNGRETNVTITMAGRLAYAMLRDKKEDCWKIDYLVYLFDIFQFCLNSDLATKIV